MSPRDSIDIATAALRWHTAYERRRAAGSAKRSADKALKESANRVVSGALSRSVDASRRVTELKRQERAAMRALSKLCAKARGDLQDADIVDTAPRPMREITCS